MNSYSTSRLTRISKAKARALWGKENVNISFCPCNLRPDGPWRPNMDIFGKDIKKKLESEYEHENNEAKFENVVKNFEWYNCTGNETGNYTSFYLIRN